MVVLHSLLAMYGAFDQVARETQEPDVLARVEQILPGTTGESQRGWYEQIKQFVRDNATRPVPEAEVFKSPQAALQEFTGQGDGLDGTPAPMSPRELGRLIYAAKGLQELKTMQEGRSNPVPVLQEIDMELFTTLFAIAGIPVELRGGSEPIVPDSRAIELEQMLAGFEGPEDWTQRITDAANADQPLVAPDIATIPPFAIIGESTSPLIRAEKIVKGVLSVSDDLNKVTGEVIEVDDVLCALLTTEFTRTPYDAKAVKEIIDPLNWDNCNTFFSKMSELSTDGRSSQVLEEVSTDDTLYTIKTALKYVKEERGDSFVINYDFAKDRDDLGDSKQVLVDSGYIIVRPTDDGLGTRVLTSKMVAIEGLSPTAVAIYAHSMGWVAIGEMMMFDCAAAGDIGRPGDPAREWKKSPDSGAGNRAGRHTSTTSATTESAEPPPPVTQIFVKEATKAVAEYIDIAAKETAVVADKWVNGDLSVEDVIKHTRTLGGKLASEPFTILDRMIKQMARSRISADPTKEGGSP